MNTPILKPYPQLLTIIATLLCLHGSLGQAQDSPYIPFTKGSFKQIQEDNKNTPYVIVFWSETCAYCMKELALFGDLLPKYPNIKVITITTDPFLEDSTVNQILSDSKLETIETWVFADNFAERLYYDINPRWRGELPLTYFFDSNNKMVKHMGIVKEAELIKWMEQQSVAVSQLEMSDVNY